MRFEIRRTSTYSKPCEEAIFYCKDRLDNSVYVINIESIEELYEFISKYNGRVVILTKEEQGLAKLELPIIEIYDGYRE